MAQILKRGIATFFIAFKDAIYTNFLQAACMCMQQRSIYAIYTNFLQAACMCMQQRSIYAIYTNFLQAACICIQQRSIYAIYANFLQAACMCMQQRSIYAIYTNFLQAACMCMQQRSIYAIYTNFLQTVCSRDQFSLTPPDARKFLLHSCPSGCNNPKPWDRITSWYDRATRPAQAQIGSEEGLFISHG